MAWQGKVDPMEEMTERWLVANGIRFVDRDQGPARLDFYLPDFDVHIEVKRFHSERIGEQMGRAENVICIQGMKSLEFLEHFLHWKKLKERTGT